MVTLVWTAHVKFMVKYLCVFWGGRLGVWDQSPPDAPRRHVAEVFAAIIYQPGRQFCDKV